MTGHQQQTLNGLRATKGYYTTREIAEIYHVSPTTVCNWIKKGWLQGEMKEPISKGAKTMRGRYHVFPQAVEDIEVRKDELIEQSRRYWVRLLRQLNK